MTGAAWLVPSWMVSVSWDESGESTETGPAEVIRNPGANTSVRNVPPFDSLSRCEKGVQRPGRVNNTFPPST